MDKKLEEINQSAVRIVYSDVPVEKNPLKIPANLIPSFIDYNTSSKIGSV
jgi:hypothetical protein